jgi:hypothetical protein
VSVVLHCNPSVCPELIHQFCIFIVSHLASSVVLREGSPHPITNGTVGKITKNGVFTAVFSNMISLSLPALISVLIDREHVKTYLLRRSLFKADIGHRDKVGGVDSHSNRYLTV